jgi:hypothetical protein
MAAYLVVDVDNLLERFQQKGISFDVQELAVGLRGGAALAAGLVSADKLKAIAVTNWAERKAEGSVDSLHIPGSGLRSVRHAPARKPGRRPHHPLFLV